ncbi:MAG: flagellar protein FlaG [Chloroflexi bacterium]|nr:flagellar protein FlaG [Chloroflexota bacterium]
MGITGISRIDVVDLPAMVTARAPVAQGRFSGGEMPMEEGIVVRAAAQASPPLVLAEEPAELEIGQTMPVPGGGELPESYAKIRYDQDTNTVLIQIVSASSGDVIREIPPDAWNRVRENTPLPKGTLVEKHR